MLGDLLGDTLTTIDLEADSLTMLQCGQRPRPEIDTETRDLDAHAQTKGICPVCRKLLDTKLVVSRCNHVFHRDCLPGRNEPCPQCDEPDAGKCTLDLYGVSFGDASDPGAATLAARLAADRSRGTAVSSSATVVDLDNNETQVDSEDTPTVTDEVAKLCADRDAVRELKRRLEELKARVETAGQEEILQHMKRQTVEEQANKREAEREKVSSELAKCEEEEKGLLERMNEIRQRDTVLEYADLLKTKTDAEALKYLTTMVNVVQEPWRILVEVARLRDFHRAQLDGWAKDRASCSRQHREARSHLEGHVRKVAELQKELERGGSSLQRERGRTRETGAIGREMAPAAKRLRPPLQLEL